MVASINTALGGGVGGGMGGGMGQVTSLPEQQSPSRERGPWEGGWGDASAKAAAAAPRHDVSNLAGALQREHSYGSFGLEDSALIRNLDSLLLDEPDLN